MSTPLSPSDQQRDSLLMDASGSPVTRITTPAQQQQQSPPQQQHPESPASSISLLLPADHTNTDPCVHSPTVVAPTVPELTETPQAGGDDNAETQNQPIVSPSGGSDHSNDAVHCDDTNNNPLPAVSTASSPYLDSWVDLSSCEGSSGGEDDDSIAPVTHNPCDIIPPAATLSQTDMSVHDADHNGAAGVPDGDDDVVIQSQQQQQQQPNVASMLPPPSPAFTAACSEALSEDDQEMLSSMPPLAPGASSRTSTMISGGINAVAPLETRSGSAILGSGGNSSSFDMSSLSHQSTMQQQQQQQQQGLTNNQSDHIIAANGDDEATVVTAAASASADTVEQPSDTTSDINDVTPVQIDMYTTQNNLLGHVRFDHFGVEQQQQEQAQEQEQQEQEHDQQPQQEQNQEQQIEQSADNIMSSSSQPDMTQSNAGLDFSLIDIPTPSELGIDTGDDAARPPTIGEGVEHEQEEEEQEHEQQEQEHEHEQHEQLSEMFPSPSFWPNESAIDTEHKQNVSLSLSAVSSSSSSLSASIPTCDGTSKPIAIIVPSAAPAAQAPVSSLTRDISTLAPITTPHTVASPAFSTKMSASPPTSEFMLAFSHMTHMSTDDKSSQPTPAAFAPTLLQFGTGGDQPCVSWPPLPAKRSSNDGGEHIESSDNSTSSDDDDDDDDINMSMIDDEDIADQTQTALAAAGHDGHNYSNSPPPVVPSVDEYDSPSSVEAFQPPPPTYQDSLTVESARELEALRLEMTSGGLVSSPNSNNNNNNNNNNSSIIIPVEPLEPSPQYNVSSTLSQHIATPIHTTETVTSDNNTIQQPSSLDMQEDEDELMMSLMRLDHQSSASPSFPRPPLPVSPQGAAAAVSSSNALSGRQRVPIPSSVVLPSSPSPLPPPQPHQLDNPHENDVESPPAYNPEDSPFLRHNHGFPGGHIPSPPHIDLSMSLSHEEEAEEQQQQQATATPCSQPQPQLSVEIATSIVQKPNVTTPRADEIDLDEFFDLCELALNSSDVPSLPGFHTVDDDNHIINNNNIEDTSTTTTSQQSIEPNSDISIVAAAAVNAADNDNDDDISSQIDHSSVLHADNDAEIALPPVTTTTTQFVTNSIDDIDDSTIVQHNNNDTDDDDNDNNKSSHVSVAMEALPAVDYSEPATVQLRQRLYNAIDQLGTLLDADAETMPHRAAAASAANITSSESSSVIPACRRSVFRPTNEAIDTSYELLFESVNADDTFTLPFLFDSLQTSPVTTDPATFMDPIDNNYNLLHYCALYNRIETGEKLILYIGFPLYHLTRFTRDNALHIAYMSLAKGQAFATMLLTYATEQWNMGLKTTKTSTSTTSTTTTSTSISASDLTTTSMSTMFAPWNINIDGDDTLLIAVRSLQLPMVQSLLQYASLINIPFNLTWRNRTDYVDVFTSLLSPSIDMYTTWNEQLSKHPLVLSLHDLPNGVTASHTTNEAILNELMRVQNNILDNVMEIFALLHATYTTQVQTLSYDHILPENPFMLCYGQDADSLLLQLCYDEQYLVLERMLSLYPEECAQTLLFVNNDRRTLYQAIIAAMSSLDTQTLQIPTNQSQQGDISTYYITYMNCQCLERIMQMFEENEHFVPEIQCLQQTLQTYTMTTSDTTIQPLDVPLPEGVIPKLVHDSFYKAMNFYYISLQHSANYFTTMNAVWDNELTTIEQKHELLNVINCDFYRPLTMTIVNENAYQTCTDLTFYSRNMGLLQSLLGDNSVISHDEQQQHHHHKPRVVIEEVIEEVVVGGGGDVGSATAADESSSLNKEATTIPMIVPLVETMKSSTSIDDNSSDIIPEPRSHVSAYPVELDDDDTTIDSNNNHHTHPVEEAVEEVLATTENTTTTTPSVSSPILNHSSHAASTTTIDQSLLNTLLDGNAQMHRSVEMTSSEALRDLNDWMEHIGGVRVLPSSLTTTIIPTDIAQAVSPTSQTSRPSVIGQSELVAQPVQQPSSSSSLIIPTVEPIDNNDSVLPQTVETTATATTADTTTTASDTTAAAAAAVFQAFDAFDSYLDIPSREGSHLNATTERQLEIAHAVPQSSTQGVGPSFVEQIAQDPVLHRLVTECPSHMVQLLRSVAYSVLIDPAFVAVNNALGLSYQQQAVNAGVVPQQQQQSSLSSPSQSGDNQQEQQQQQQQSDAAAAVTQTDGLGDEATTPVSTDMSTTAAQEAEIQVMSGDDDDAHNEFQLQVAESPEYDDEIDIVDDDNDAEQELIAPDITTTTDIIDNSKPATVAATTVAEPRQQLLSQTFSSSSNTNDASNNNSSIYPTSGLDNRSSSSHDSISDLLDQLEREEELLLGAMPQFVFANAHDTAVGKMQNVPTGNRREVLERQIRTTDIRLRKQEAQAMEFAQTMGAVPPISNEIILQLLKQREFLQEQLDALEDDNNNNNRQ